MRSNDIMTGTLNTANRRGKLVPYLKFDGSWQAGFGGWYVGGDVVPVDVAKWGLEAGNIDGRRFSANPNSGSSGCCWVNLIDELQTPETPSHR